MMYGQQGTIVFNRKENWINITSKLPYLSLEEKDRIKLTWGKNKDDKGDDYLYTFNGKGNMYQEMEKKENYGYYWDSESDIVVRDLETKKTKDIKILLGSQYVVEDDIPRIKWKILNEIKEIAGYLCMKAETYDTVNQVVVHAWFTDKIPYFGGPEGFSGLPGMILAIEFNTDDVQIIATKVSLTEEPPVLPLPKKFKGKKVSISEFNQKKKKHIILSKEGRRNPYWDVRY